MGNEDMAGPPYWGKAVHLLSVVLGLSVEQSGEGQMTREEC